MFDVAAPSDIIMAKRVRSREAWYKYLTRILAAVLVAAAALKAHALAGGATGAAGDLGIPTAPAMGAGLIVLEVLLAAWMVADTHPLGAWRAAVTCFACFGVAASYQALSGRTTCGCFGSLPVSPRYTALFDIAAVVLLVLFRPRSSDARLACPRSRAQRVAGVAIAGLIAGAAATYAAARFEPASLAELGQVTGSGVIVLQPDKWLGKPFPLLRHINAAGANLVQGRWTVVLYHYDCPLCREVVARLQEEARDAPAGPDAESARVALIEMPPYAPPGEGEIAASSGCVLGQLSNDRDWFTTTPLVIALSDGDVVSVRQGKDATPPTPEPDGPRANAPKGR